MASYDLAYPEVVKDEGHVLTIDPTDRGGMSYAGISSVKNPQWEGFVLIRSIELKPGQSSQELNDMAKVFYKTNYWMPIHGDEIINQDAATQLLDSAVNNGISGGVKLTQEALGIAQTGLMDDVTLNSLNAQNNYA